jgi:transcriptional regulator GlxA family with amidase domain
MDVETIAILIFDDVEELDFAGPLEVFGTAVRLRGRGEVHVVALGQGEVRCRYGLRVIARNLDPKHDRYDLLILPGGPGARVAALKDNEVLQYIRSHKGIIASVCTGALVLGAAGVLAGIEATTHHAHLETLRAYAGVQVRSDKRYTHSERVWTSAGVSAGIDLALALVAHLWGAPLAEQVANNMEWPLLYRQSARR